MPHKDPAAKKAYAAAYHQSHKAARAVEREAWNQRNPKRRAATFHKSRLKLVYNMTPEDYDTMLKVQNGGCEICKVTPEELGKKLCVDHNHETDKVRGLLCDRCNTMIGKARENPEWFHKAVKYILDWRAKHEGQLA